MRRKGAIFGLVLALLTFITLEKPAYAHIRWIVDKGDHAGEHYTMDLTSILVILGAILFVALALAIDRANWPAKIRVIAENVYLLFPVGNEWRIVASLTGILLIINAINGVFLAADLVLPNEGLVILGKTAQIVIGLMLVTQISFSLAGLLILVVAVPLALIALPISLLVAYLFEFAALSLALIFVGISSCYLDQVA